MPPACPQPRLLLPWMMGTHWTSPQQLQQGLVSNGWLVRVGWQWFVSNALLALVDFDYNGLQFMIPFVGQLMVNDGLYILVANF